MWLRYESTIQALWSTPLHVNRKGLNIVREKRFLTRLSSGVLVGALAAGGVLLAGGVSHAAPPVTPAVTAMATTTALTTSPESPVVQGNPVTLTATVTPTAATGTVQFKDGTLDLGQPVAVSSGTASMSTSMLPVGSRQLTAMFIPANSMVYRPSTSPAVTVVVTAAGAPTAPTGGGAAPATSAALRATILAQSTGSIDLLPSSKVELGAKLTDAATGEPVVARRIEFYGGGQELCEATTDTYGWVRCSAAENFGPQTVNEIVAGYDAVFSGDREYGPSTQHASATIGTNRSKP